MVNGIIIAMITTIDAAGRLVLPKAARERAQLAPGMPIEVRVVDGRVELEPACARVTIEKRGGVWVASPTDAVPTLTQDQVHATIEALRLPVADRLRDAD
jgi:AbrB family looped-hinge helix DNA binding protein